MQAEANSRRASDSKNGRIVQRDESSLARRTEWKSGGDWQFFQSVSVRSRCTHGSTPPTGPSGSRFLYLLVWAHAFGVLGNLLFEFIKPSSRGCDFRKQNCG
jgi:hypothetical protein